MVEPAQLAVDPRRGAFYGGSTQVHLGPGPAIDPIHEASLSADSSVLDRAVLLVESSEDLIPAAVAAVVVARPPTSSLDQPPRQRPTSKERAALRSAQKDTAIDVIGRYNPDAVIVVGVPFGHTRPQWILPYGGELTVDAEGDLSLIRLIREPRRCPA